MTPQWLAAITEAMLPGVLGMYFTLRGYEYIPRKQTSDMLEQEKETKRLAVYRKVGPLLVVVSILYLLARGLISAG